MPKASSPRSSSRSSKRSAARRKRQGPKHFASLDGGRRRYYLQEIMVALASAGATYVRTKSLRYLVCRALVRLPCVSSCFPLLDFAGMAINAVTINSRTCFGIATALGVVNFAQNEFKICVRRLFGAVRDAIQ